MYYRGEISTSPELRVATLSCEIGKFKTTSELIFCQKMYLFNLNMKLSKTET